MIPGNIACRVRVSEYEIHKRYIFPGYPEGESGFKTVGSVFHGIRNVQASRRSLAMVVSSITLALEQRRIS